MEHIKNPLFIKNCTDPNNGKLVREIKLEKHMKDTVNKKDRKKLEIVWQHMRDRKRQSVENIYKKYYGQKLEIIYFN
jgi:hypothetical protein